MKSRWIIALFGLLGCLLSTGWFVWKQFESHGTPSAPRPVLTVGFGDGAVMDVLAMGIGSVRYEQTPASPSDWGPRQNESSTYAHGYFHGGGFRTQVLKENGANAWTAHQDHSRPLLIGIRLTDASGKPVKVASSFSAEWPHDDERLIARGGANSIKELPAHLFTGPDAAEQMKRNGIAYSIQHHDPDSGWIALSGPLWIGEDHPGDHVVALSVWRRDLSKLKFRVLRDDGVVVEFDLPAPPTPAGDTRVIVPEPMPITRTGRDYQVRLENIEVRPQAGRPPAIHAEPVLESPRYLVGNGAAAHLEGSFLGVRDEAGNLDPFLIYHKKAGGGFFQSHSRRLELLYQVKRLRAFPSDASDVLFIAEGEVEANGTGVRVTLLPEGTARMGLHKVEIPAIEPSDNSFVGDAIGDQMIRIHVEGKISDAAMPAMFRGHVPDALRVVVFQADDAESSGIPWFRGSNHSSTSSSVRLGNSVAALETWKFTRTECWYAPKAALAPGQRIRIALAAPLKDDVHVFPIEIPAGAFASDAARR